MKPYIVEPGEGTDYDWSQDHISVKTPADLTAGRVTVVLETISPSTRV